LVRVSTNLKLRSLRLEQLDGDQLKCKNKGRKQKESGLIFLFVFSRIEILRNEHNLLALRKNYSKKSIKLVLQWGENKNPH